VALLDRAIVRLLPAVPKPVVQRLSSRYIAGSHLADAARVAREANAARKLATIDVLGEESRTKAEARAMVDEYVDVLRAIDAGALDCNISVKLTGLGLRVGYAVCHDNVRRLLDHAREYGTFVRIEMEDATTTDDTLTLYRELRDEGWDKIGTVLQSSLRRTLADVRALADLKPNIRLVKGIYIESPQIQFKEFEAVRAAYVQLLDALLDAGCYVAAATHDDWLVEQSLERYRRRGLGPGEYEFQMLLGVKAELGDRLVADGHRLRLYIPYGRDWYDYSLRRLQENPKVAGYIAADTLGRLVPRRNGAA
jgi:proline dehydrogenase